MASKFDKEEKFCYDSNTDSDGETNNSKTRSGSSSPTPQFEERIVNQTGRSGGPCAANVIKCYQCGATCNLTKVSFTCDQYTYLCNHCHDRYLFTCPEHPQSRRKYA